MSTSPDAPRTTAPSAPRSPASLMVGTVAAAALALVATTQVLAYRAGFHPALGEPLVALPESAAALTWGGAVSLFVAALATLAGRPRWGLAPLGVLAAGAAVTALMALGPIYPVDAGARWAWRAVRTGGPDGKAALATFGASFLLGLVALLASSARVRVAGTHGTATWGDGGALRGRSGLLLGRHRGRDLRYDGPGHLLTVAPTRAGKGVGAVIPALLETDDSVVVTDPKGENFAITAAFRQGTMRQRVIALDPFRLVDRLGVPPGVRAAADGAYNPVDLVDTESPDALDDAAMLADMLVVPEPGDHGAFWDDEARALLAGLILHVAHVAETAGTRTLLTVRALLTLAPEDFGELLGKMRRSEVPAVQRTANRILQKADRERSSVVSSAQRHTHFLDSPRMERVLGGPSDGCSEAPLALSDLGAGPVTLYLIVPPDRLDTFARWLRLVIACAVTELARRPPQGRRVLFLLDEFAQLGPMAPVRRAVSLMAGYGLRVWTFLQDLTQLKALYPRNWETFVANADVVQAFCVTDQTTAEYLSKMCGRTTVFGRSQTAGRNRGHRSSYSAGRSASEQGRDLMTADELRRLGDDSQLILSRGKDPVLARKVRYFSDRRLARRAAKKSTPSEHRPTSESRL